MSERRSSTSFPLRADILRDLYRYCVMAKKKREHVVFDQMLKQKKSIPFSKTANDGPQKQKNKVKGKTRGTT